MQGQQGINLRNHLRLGERVLWEGKPRQGIIFRSTDLTEIPFSLFWGGFALFWNYQVWRDPLGEGNWFFRVWGIPFLIVGFYFIFGRFLHDMLIRRGTSYAITDQRILIMRKKFGSVSIKEFDIAYLPVLELRLTGNSGRGDIIFESSSLGNMPFANGLGSWAPFTSADRFDSIEQAAATYQLIERAARSKAR